MESILLWKTRDSEVKVEQHRPFFPHVVYFGIDALLISPFSLPRLLVMRMFNLHGTEKEKEDEESSEEESDEEEEEEKKPQMELAMMPHYGGINRVRVGGVPFSRQASLIVVPEGPEQHVFLWNFRRRSGEISHWPPCGRRKDR